MPKILIIRLSSLGDIIHVYPMIYDIKMNIKNCQIDVLVDDSFKNLVECNFLVDNIITIPLRRWKKDKLQIFSEFMSWKSLLSLKKYDYIIDVQGMLKSAFLTRYFDGTVYGYGFLTLKEKLSGLFYKHRITIKEDFVVTRHRKLGSKIFNYDIDLNNINFGLDLNKIHENVYKLTPKTQDRILEIDGPYVMCFCMASIDSKKYSSANWVKLFKYLIDTYNFSILITFGSMAEKIEVTKLKNMVNSENVIIPEHIHNYLELHQLIQKSSFVFGVDTGLTHVANALNKKMIAIFTDTNPKDTGICENKNAINMGNKNNPPAIESVIEKFEEIMKNV